jgi:putative SOS response-associated peptidase YedK
MCFFSRLTISASELKSRFQADFGPGTSWEPTMEFNGFTHPKTPAIANDQPDRIRMFEWGLLPSWAKDKSLQNNTLNARIETLHEKPSFRSVLTNRCLIPANGFYEWQWLDPEGKKKQKYLITVEDEEAFAFAGLWNAWTDRLTGEIIETYTIITRPANGLMARIHNSKLRMPWILPHSEESDWLAGKQPIYKEVPFRAEPIGGMPDLF